ncbi:MAG: septum formation initiator [Bacteroidetes bacterium B1(2017)]|nr:MAG: septum formation initiator [Bacteroidetes bacterium B1(2017)]
MKLNANYIKPFRNKYVLAGIAFFVLLLVNERNSIFDQLEYRKDLKEAQQKFEYYQTEIQKVKKEKEELFGNKKNLEKFAREKYLMKADNEDVFVMIEEE